MLLHRGFFCSEAEVDLDLAFAIVDNKLTLEDLENLQLRKISIDQILNNFKHSCMIEADFATVDFAIAKLQPIQSNVTSPTPQIAPKQASAGMRNRFVKN